MMKRLKYYITYFDVEFIYCYYYMTLFIFYMIIVHLCLYLGAVKIGTGKINVVTGNSWLTKQIRHIHHHNYQNYVALPRQLWLDGINCGEGYIRQFVAMPLGKGYTIEVKHIF